MDTIDFIIVMLFVMLWLAIIALVSNLNLIKKWIYKNPHWVIFIDTNEIKLKDIKQGKFSHRGSEYLYDDNPALTKGSNIIICHSKKAINIPLDSDTPSSEEHTTFYHEKVFEQLMLIFQDSKIPTIIILVIANIVLTVLDLIKDYGFLK